MRSGRKFFALGALLLLVTGLGACSSGPDPAEEKAAQDAEAWAALQEAKATLDAKRAELKTLKEKIAGKLPEEEGDTDAAEGTEDTEGGEEAAPVSPEELQAQADALKEEIFSLTDDFAGQLIGFINSQGLVEGAELTTEQREAFNMKAQEDILVAQEYISEGGDYQRAIDIYTTSLLSDPTNELLLEAKAKAEELRYMTEERLGEVKKKMTRDEVRDLLGIPKTSNIREFDNGVIGWFYPKETPREAAGVFFQEKGGEFTVYKIDWNAIKAEE